MSDLYIIKNKKLEHIIDNFENFLNLNRTIDISRLLKFDTKTLFANYKHYSNFNFYIEDAPNIPILNYSPNMEYYMIFGNDLNRIAVLNREELEKFQKKYNIQPYFIPALDGYIRRITSNFIIKIEENSKKPNSFSNPYLNHFKKQFYKTIIEIKKMISSDFKIIDLFKKIYNVYSEFKAVTIGQPIHKDMHIPFILSKCEEYTSHFSILYNKLNINSIILEKPEKKKFFDLKSAAHYTMRILLDEYNID